MGCEQGFSNNASIGKFGAFLWGLKITLKWKRPPNEDGPKERGIADSWLEAVCEGLGSVTVRAAVRNPQINAG